MKYSYQVLLPVEINIQHENNDEDEGLDIAERIQIAIIQLVKEKFNQVAVIETICVGDAEEYMK